MIHEEKKIPSFTFFLLKLQKAILIMSDRLNVEQKTEPLLVTRFLRHFLWHNVILQMTQLSRTEGTFYHLKMFLHQLIQLSSFPGMH